MARLQNLGFRGNTPTPTSVFTVVAAVTEIDMAFSDKVGFPGPGSYILPTGLENFFKLRRTGGWISVVAALVGTRFLVLPCGVPGRSL